MGWVIKELHETHGAIDLHAHILPGLDDGPPDLVSAVALAQAMTEAGTSTVVATPHVSERYPTTVSAIDAAARALREALATANVPLRVLTGAEVALDQISRLTDDELMALRLGGGPALLVESPLSSSAGDFEWQVEAVMERGLITVLAHPERCPAFQREPVRLERLVSRGALGSLTAGALEGRFGQDVRRFSARLLRQGLVHDIASDAHDLRRRPPGMGPGLAAGNGLVPGLAEHAAWFTRHAPAAIVQGAPLERPPDLEPAPRRFGRLVRAWNR